MTLAWIVQLAITCIVGIIAYFLKDMKKTHEDKIEQLEFDVKEAVKKAEKNKDDLNDYKEEVSKEYVKQVDYLRTTGEISRKLDKIFDILMDMNKKGVGQ